MCVCVRVCACVYVYVCFLFSLLKFIFTGNICLLILTIYIFLNVFFYFNAIAKSKSIFQGEKNHFFYSPLTKFNHARKHSLMPALGKKPTTQFKMSFIQTPTHTLTGQIVVITAFAPEIYTL